MTDTQKMNNARRFSNSSSKLAMGPWILAAMIVLACLSRLLPHPPNFSPIAAVALFGGAFFANRGLAVFVPLAALFASDVILAVGAGGLYSGYIGSTGQMLVYAATALISVIGFSLRKNQRSLPVIGAGLVGTAMFFLITNFGAFLSDPNYPKTLAGLGAAYVAGIPFLKWSVISTMMFSAILFGGFQLLRQKNPALRAQTV